MLRSPIQIIHKIELFFIFTLPRHLFNSLKYIIHYHDTHLTNFTTHSMYNLLSLFLRPSLNTYRINRKDTLSIIHCRSTTKMKYDMRILIGDFFKMQETSTNATDNSFSNDTTAAAAAAFKVLLSVVLAPTLAIVLQLFISSKSTTNTQHHETKKSSSLHYQRRIQHASAGLMFYMLSYMIPISIAMALLLCTSSISFYTIHRARSSSISLERQ